LHPNRRLPNAAALVPRTLFTVYSDTLYHTIPDAPVIQQVPLQSQHQGSGCITDYVGQWPVVDLSTTNLPAGTQPPQLAVPLHPEFH
jgi:hypothetical protein